MTAAAWTPGSGHLRLRVRLTPRAAADRIDGIAALSDGSTVLAARVRALPEDGAANDAVTRLVAEALGQHRSSVTIVGGHKSRVKELRINGDPVTLAEAAARLWPAAG